MNTLDTIYRAFADYRKTTSEDNDCSMQRVLLARADVDKDLIECVKYTCHIDEDWVEAIETGIVFIEKAIAEERQFIRTEGEVVPIERVKMVSRDSVEHLSRHSGLITKKPEKGKPILPEKLYTVERLNDYAVYENRFLYMLLKYLEQFISLRYNNIVDLANTYRGKLFIDKVVKSGTQSVVFKVELQEERRNDPLLSELNPNKSIIERISSMLKMVVHYLSTPLMQEVSKAPMLRPPITSTNVLKMNNNFKGAMALYKFVAAYDKPGYTAEKHITTLSPFPDPSSDEYAEVEALASFLTYEYGMGVKDHLRSVYQREEERRAKEKEKKYLEQLESLRRKIANSGEGAEEYMLMLQKRNRSLEADSEQLVMEKEESAKRGKQIEQLQESMEALSRGSEQAKRELLSLQQKYADQAETIKAEFEVQLKQLNATHEEAVSALKSTHEEALSALKGEHEVATQKLRDEQAETLAAVKSQADEVQARLDRENRELSARVQELEKQNRQLEEDRRVSDARLNALRFKHGYIDNPDELTTKAAFDEIEMQYGAFTDFFKRTWKLTKKRIRKDLVEQSKQAPKPLNPKDM